MDELIRQLEERPAELQKKRDACRPDSTEARLVLDAAATAYSNAALLAEQAKRRMADREPAWDILP